MKFNRKDANQIEGVEAAPKVKKQFQLSQNAINRVIAFVMALVLWGFVAYKVNPPTTRELQEVSVRLMSMETLVTKNLAVTGDTNFKINVQLRGKRAEVYKITKENIVATANLVDIGGTGQFPVSVSVNLDGDYPNVEIVKKDFTIEVNVEKLISSEKKIRVQTLGTLPSGKELSDLSLDPEEVEVGGAKSEVDSVRYVQASLDISGLTDRESTTTLTLTPVNASGLAVENVVLSESTVDVKAKLLETKKVPLKVNTTGIPPGGLELQGISAPEEIRIKGTREELDSIKKVETEAIDLSKITDTSTTVALKLKGAEAASSSVKDLKATVTMKRTGSKEVTYSADEIGIEDLPTGFTAAISTPQIVVNVTGDESVVRGLHKEDIKPYISLKNAGAETVTAKVELRYALSLTGAVSVPAEVAVAITAVPEAPPAEEGGGTQTE